jgi:hypothetical protein
MSALVFLLAWASAGEQSKFRVHVVDPRYEDVGNAMVRLLSVQGFRTATTDTAGMATFFDLPQGKYDVRISAYGFIVWQLQNYNVTVPQNRLLQATLSFATLACDPSYHSEYDNTQPRGAPVRGSVIDADSGKGIRGATLVFRRANENKPKITIRSQSKGVFEVPDIAPGHYKLRVKNEFFREVEMDLIVPIQDAVVITVELDRNDHVRLCL